MRTLKNLLYRWLGVEGQITLLHKQHETLCRKIKVLEDRYTALIAVDWAFTESGKIILLTKMNGKDRVKIIDCKPRMGREEYNRIVQELEHKYGARLGWNDGPIESSPYKLFRY